MMRRGEYISDQGKVANRSFLYDRKDVAVLHEWDENQLEYLIKVRILTGKEGKA